MKLFARRVSQDVLKLLFALFIPLYIESSNLFEFGILKVVIHRFMIRLKTVSICEERDN